MLRKPPVLGDAAGLGRCELMLRLALRPALGDARGVGVKRSTVMGNMKVPGDVCCALPEVPGVSATEPTEWQDCELHRAEPCSARRDAITESVWETSCSGPQRGSPSLLHCTAAVADRSSIGTRGTSRVGHSGETTEVLPQDEGTAPAGGTEVEPDAGSVTVLTPTTLSYNLLCNSMLSSSRFISWPTSGFECGKEASNHTPGRRSLESLGAACAELLDSSRAWKPSAELLTFVSAISRPWEGGETRGVAALPSNPCMRLMSLRRACLSACSSLASCSPRRTAVTADSKDVFTSPRRADISWRSRFGTCSASSAPLTDAVAAARSSETLTA
mmetsp:Transcript_6730/g.12240  ORF Transcript_6730/g.12240 Transcript_6730/m.12240 type:complete len:331 (+) Transcript_6730:552-1544(+)